MTLGTISIKAWVARQDDFRVLGVGLPRPFPLIEAQCTPDHARYYIENVEPHAPSILHSHGISFETIKFGRRRSKHEAGSESENLHTLLVETTDENTGAWRAAAEQMQGLFHDADVASEEIEVEICNLCRMKHNISTLSVDRDDRAAMDRAVDSMRDVRPAIMDTVQSLCGLQWTSIGFHLRKHRFNKAIPASPTCLVFFSKTAVLDFDTIQSRLLEILGHSEVPIKLEILQGFLQGTISD